MLKLTKIEICNFNLQATVSLSNRDARWSDVIRIMKLTALAGLVVASATAMEMNLDNFESEVLNSGKGGLVEFLAPW